MTFLLRVITFISPITANEPDINTLLWCSAGNQEEPAEKMASLVFEHNNRNEYRHHTK